MHMYLIKRRVNSMTKASHSSSSGTTLTMISRDVEFDEEGVWDFGSDNDTTSIPPFGDPRIDEQIREEQQEQTTPPVSPAKSVGGSPPSFLNERATQHTRNLAEVYEDIERLEDLTLFCLFADCEPVNYEEAAESKNWRVAMDEEIKATEKNDTWELVTLPKGHKAIGDKIDKYLEDNAFTKCPHEHALYVKSKENDVLIVCLYVDDLIFTRNNPSMFEEFKKAMTDEFEMTDIGLMAYYLGVEVKQLEDGVFITQ
ncbi:hypothetical protein SASPL_108171 [Salvia splendens]|uniref:Reverse transcriptase Ty1/copia-type domain-containing protein n=1 Tax=Salvia splendens TaxID=180675 RepID=A0A8X8YBS7_SALSN|nr:hypothetical protein SASPL_108171 [Salvia splendens]